MTEAIKAAVKEGELAKADARRELEEIHRAMSAAQQSNAEVKRQKQEHELAVHKPHLMQAAEEIEAAIKAGNI